MNLQPYFFSIKQLTRIKKKEKEMQQFDKNVVDSKVFGKKINLWQLLKEANPIFYPFVGVERNVITPLLIRLKIPRTEISPLALLLFV